MSYERQMIAKLAMPAREKIQAALLRQLMACGGAIKEFGESEAVVGEMADHFGLDNIHRHAVLETVYRKENRVKKSSLWHRMLFRAADELSRKGLMKYKKIARDMINRSKPPDHTPIDASKEKRLKRASSMLRRRGFRQAVMEAYGYRCAVCGLKMPAPKGLS